MQLLSLFYRQEGRQPSWPWFARVPSFSSPADAPSRGQVAEAAADFRAQAMELPELSAADLAMLCALPLSPPP